MRILILSDDLVKEVFCFDNHEVIYCYKEMIKTLIDNSNDSWKLRVIDKFDVKELLYQKGKSHKEAEELASFWFDAVMDGDPFFIREDMEESFNELWDLAFPGYTW